MRISSSSSSSARTSPGSPGGGQAQAGEAPDPHHLRAERDGLDHVGAAHEAAVHHHDRGAPATAFTTSGSTSMRAAAVIELAAAVVGDVDAVHAVVAGDGRVLGGGDALQDQRDVVAVLEALDLVPRERGLEVHAGGAHGATA